MIRFSHLCELLGSLLLSHKHRYILYLELLIQEVLHLKMKFSGWLQVVVLFGFDWAEGQLYKAICIFSWILIEHNIPFFFFLRIQKISTFRNRLWSRAAYDFCRTYFNLWAQNTCCCLWLIWIWFPIGMFLKFPMQTMFSSLLVSTLAREKNMTVLSLLSWLPLSLCLLWSSQRWT